MPNTATSISHSLNGADLALLLQFTTQTGRSLAHPDPPDNPVALFWSHNVPQIGLTHHAVMHLLLALAARHLAWLVTQDPETRIQYVSLAENHISAGLTELTMALKTMNDSTCGFLYVSAILVSFCTLAAGPTGPNDLLVCDVTSQAQQPWMSVIQGVRLIQETFSPNILFSGLLAPLAPPAEAESVGIQPRCEEEGFPRLDWEEPLGHVRDLIASSNSEDTATYLESFRQVEAIYEATYGKSNGSSTFELRFRFVFIWLYTMSDDFVRCLQQRQPLSLIILAYYAFLLTTLKRDWYVQSWPRHILTRVREMIDKDYTGWLRWPLEQAGISMFD